MSRFNRRGVRASVSSPVTTETRPTGITHEGGPGYARDEKSQLFLLAVSYMAGEDTFYERAQHRGDWYTMFVQQLAVKDADWTARLLGWLRTEANMRSAAVVGAAEYVKARLDAGRTHEADGLSSSTTTNRRVIDSVLQRADEPGEMLAYWTTKYGRNIPKPVKRGVADAVGRLYTEHSLLKYDTDSKGFRFGDVIDLVHPIAGGHDETRRLRQGALFAHALDRRHKRGTLPAPELLPMLAANLSFLEAAGADPRRLLDTDALKGAGLTWENALSLAGGQADKKALWEALIPTMGYMALLRNLRNFDEARVSDEAAERVAAKLADPEQVAKSRQFPFRFLAAYNAAPSLRWSWALEKALDASLSNVPSLPGRTLILVDRSSSMFGRVSKRSGLNWADSAAIFGTALALRAASADLVEFGTGHRPIQTRAGSSVLSTLRDFTEMGGTDTAEAVRATYRGHDRVVIVTDEQVWPGYRGGDPLGQIPANVPAYTWNLAGHNRGHGPSGGQQRHTFGGLTDTAFGLIPLLEAGHNATWPF